jgi:hypothetical protein
MKRRLLAAVLAVLALAGMNRTIVDFGTRVATPGNGFNPSISAATLTFSGTNNITATTTSPNDTWRAALSVALVCNTKIYSEFSIGAVSMGGNGVTLGFANPLTGVNTQIASGALHGQSSWWQANGTSFGGLGTPSGLSYSNTDVVSLAVDGSNGKAWMRVNGGSWAGGGDPVAETTPSGTLQMGYNAGLYMVFWGDDFSGVADTVTINGGNGSGGGFTYTVPSGYKGINFATPCTFSSTSNGFNPAISSPNFTFSGTNNITAVGASNATWKSALSTTSKSSGLWFEEIIVGTIGGSNGFIWGLGNASTNPASYSGSDANSMGCQSTGGAYGGFSSCPSIVAGQVIDIAFDVGTKKVWTRVDGGAWAGGGDPVAETTPSGTWSFSGAVFLTFSSYDGAAATLYGGSTPVYPPPSGYTNFN